MGWGYAWATSARRPPTAVEVWRASSVSTVLPSAHAADRWSSHYNQIMYGLQITAVPDRPPEVDFVTQDRNRAVNPGGSLAVTIKATDDYGVASISLWCFRL